MVLQRRNYQKRLFARIVDDEVLLIMKCTLRYMELQIDIICSFINFTWVGDGVFVYTYTQHGVDTP